MKSIYRIFTKLYSEYLIVEIYIYIFYCCVLFYFLYYFYSFRISKGNVKESIKYILINAAFSNTEMYLPQTTSSYVEKVLEFRRHVISLHCNLLDSSCDICNTCYLK